MSDEQCISTTLGRVRAVLQRYPRLIVSGFWYAPNQGPLRGLAAYQRLCELRKAFFHFLDLRAFELACEWLDRQPRAPIARRSCEDSYYLKHRFEDETGHHCQNGVFIAAAVDRGIEIEPDAPNAVIGIKWGARRDKESRALMDARLGIPRPLTRREQQRQRGEIWRRLRAADKHRNALWKAFDALGQRGNHQLYLDVADAIHHETWAAIQREVIER
jgi:hypothetical protein